MEPREIIYFRETNWQSIVADTYMFLTLIGAMAINEAYLGGNKVWTVAMIILVITVAISKGNQKKIKFGSKKELIDHLNKTEPNKNFNK